MKILVVLSRFPFPLEKGDKLRAYHQIRGLAEHHDIYLAAMHDKPVTESDLRELEPFCKGIFLLENDNVRRCWNVGRAFLKGLPLQCGLFFNKKNVRILDNIVQKVKPDHIYCQLFRMAEYVMHYDIPKTLDYQDVFSKGMARRAEKSKGIVKWVFQTEQRRVARYEAGIFNRFDHKTIITEVDRSLIPHPDRDDIVVVPNGVDFERFSCHGERKEYDLIFSGNMGYAPNVDAALFLAENILPELLPDFPDLKLVLCGASPSPRVLALQGEHVLVTGWVDSMAEWYAKSKVFVAPMRMGTGLQNKLLEAMAMSLPCVTSPLAAKPLMEAGQHHAVLTCETAGQFADTLRRLLQDAEYSQEVATAGNQYVRQYYDWKAAVDLLENVMTGS